jgi:small subunit ribosomal protein S20
MEGEINVANHPSALKRARQNTDRRLRNRISKTTIKNVTKSLRESVADNSAEAAAAQLKEATSTIDKAAKKGAIHKRTASRRISRLAKLVNTLKP